MSTRQKANSPAQSTSSTITIERDEDIEAELFSSSREMGVACFPDPEFEPET